MEIDAKTALFVLAAAAAVLVPLCRLAEKRQADRRDLDRPGWVSWPTMQILAMIVVVVAVVLGLKA